MIYLSCSSQTMHQPTRREVCQKSSSHDSTAVCSYTRKHRVDGPVQPRTVNTYSERRLRKLLSIRSLPLFRALYRWNNLFPKRRGMQSRYSGVSGCTSRHASKKHVASNSPKPSYYDFKQYMHLSTPSAGHTSVPVIMADFPSVLFSALLDFSRSLCNDRLG